MRGTRAFVSIGAFVQALAVYVCFAATARAVPPGRHYEMVSPPYKGGYGVNFLDGVAVAGGQSMEGDRVIFASLGTFEGAQLSENPILGNHYLAVRSATGWSTAPVMLPATRSMPSSGVFSFSASLRSVLFGGELAPDQASEYNGYSAEPFELEYLLQRIGVTEAQPLVQPLVRLDEGPQLEAEDVAGASPGLCHVLFKVGFSGGAEVPNLALLPEAEGTLSTLYELSAGDTVAGCSGAPALRLLAVTNNVKPNGEHEPIDPYCHPSLGSGGEGDRFNAVSADGAEVFFTDNANLAAPACDSDGYSTGYGPTDPAILFVRLNGERTVEISTPVEADCEKGAACYRAIEAGSSFTGRQRAEYAGADEAGARVFFTTMQPLTTGDAEFRCEQRSGGLGEFETQTGCEGGTGQKPNAGWKRFGNDLYMAEIGCPASRSCAPAEREVISLTQISHPAGIAHESGEVQGEEVVALAPNGERAYFVAQGVLSEGANREGRAPASGADNLYVYDSADNTTKFIADLCSGPESSGEIRNTRCPSSLEAIGSGIAPRDDGSLWGAASGVKQVQTTGDGQFMVFNTYARLLANDTDSARDVYRYDAATETLERVSVGEGGYDANGNNDRFDAELGASTLGGAPPEEHEMYTRAISEDGSRIVFGSAEPLSPKAVNGLANPYEWHDGEVSLVSSGSDEQPVGGPNARAVITPSGRDVFFTTVQGLLGQDTDGAVDIYDARTGEGLPPEAAPRQSCSGDACQGPLSNPAPLLVPGSFSQAPGEAATARGGHNGRRPRCRRGFRRRRDVCVRAKRKRRRRARRAHTGSSGR